VSTEVGFRISDWDTPLRVNSHRMPGRFHRAGSPPTQYVCLHPLGPWAEYLRYYDLRQPEDSLDVRLNLWVLRVDLIDAVEIDFEAVERNPWLEIEPDDLVSDDHTRCQELANRLRADAAAPKAIVVPNAALPGTRNLILFGPRVQIPYQWTPIDAGDIPVCALTKASQPPAGLLERVRFKGHPHAALDGWRSGRRFEFRDLQ
jgi:hypothetical protein